MYNGSRRIAGAVTALLVVSACGGGGGSSNGDVVQPTGPIRITDSLVKAAKSEGTLTVQYSMPLEAMQAVVKEFKKDYPGIKVVLERNAGAPGAAKLRQEHQAGVDRVDAFEGSEQAGNRDLLKDGVFANIAPPDKDALGKNQSLGPGLWAAVTEETVVAYNSHVVTDAEAKELTDWKAVLDPKWKGKISLVPPNFGVTLAPAVYMTDEPSLGVPYLEKLKAQQPKFYASTAPARDAMTSGDVPISWGHEWDAVILSLIGSGAPVRMVYPNPTPLFTGPMWGVPKKAPHPNAARLFWAWIMSKPGCTALQNPAANYRCAIKGVPDTRTVLHKVEKESWYQPPKKFYRVDLQTIAKNGRKYQGEWSNALDYHP